MTEIYYECFFKFDGEKYSTESDCVFHFTEGFWVDQWWDYVQGADPAATYWIPPSKIQYIEKKTRTVRKTKVQ